MMVDENPYDERKDRVIVFIDGNNLYHRLKDRGWKTWIDMGSLAARVTGGRNLAQIYYYNAPPPGGQPHTEKGNAFLAQVKSTPKLIFKASRLQPSKKSDELGPYQSYVEKGADTYLCTDLVSLAANDAFDIAIIISSDGDFEPAAREAKVAYGKSVEVVYFQGRRPFTMQQCATMREFRQSYLQEYDSGRPSGAGSRSGGVRRRSGGR